MAKSESIIKLRGTIGGLTFVNSTAYGEHVRAKRGTYKTAKVNDAFKAESKTLLRANVPAKIFKDAIEPYRGVLRDGLLWQRLVALFRQQLRTDGKVDFSKLKRFELHTTHTFERLMLVNPVITTDKKTSAITVVLRYDEHPQFTKVKSVDGYKLTLIGIFPDLKKKSATSTMVQSDIIEVKGEARPLRMQLAVPARAKHFIICLKLEGCVGREVSQTRTTTGLCVAGSGIV